MGLLTKFGFKMKEFVNKNNQRELIMLKNLMKDSLGPDESLNSIRIHPFYSDSSKIGKFVIPIRPQFYNTLFKDSSVRQRTLFDKDNESLNEIQGNSIIKAYICNANVKNLKKGDILLFYSSKSLKLIQPIGILDTCVRVDSISKLIAKSRGKTVYSEKQLENIFKESSGNLLMITFRLIYYLKKPIELNTIHHLECFSSKFITIKRMPESDYIYLKKEGFFDERYIID